MSRTAISIRTSAFVQKSCGCSGTTWLRVTTNASAPKLNATQSADRLRRTAHCQTVTVARTTYATRFR